MLGAVAFEEYEYWRQPDLPYSVVSGAPDGETPYYGKNDSCDGWTYPPPGLPAVTSWTRGPVRNP